MRSFGIFQTVIVLIIFVLFVYPFWRIVSKAGYSGAWSLLWFIPLVNIVALWIFAMADWPVQRGAAATLPRPGV